MLTDGDVSSDSRIQEHYNNESYQIPQADSRPPVLPSPATYEQAKSFWVDNPSMISRCSARFAAT